MKTKFVLIALPLVIQLISACSSERIELKELIINRASKVTISLNKLESNNQDSILYGNIVVAPLNKRKINFANLHCIKLLVDGQETKKIYVDSMIDYNARRLTPNENGNLSYPVYWSIDYKFDSKPISQYEFSVIALGDNESSSCITYIQ